MTSPPPGAQAQDLRQDLVIPEETKQKYPQLIELILHSESMNDEERQYWVNILPIMTEDQTENLRSILSNEKEQLAAIDKKYSKQIEQMGQEEMIRKTEVRRKELRSKRKGTEAKFEREDEEKAEELLKQIEGA